jgi:hypothetical protein
VQTVRFWIKLLLFLLPFVAAFFAVSGFTLYTGEAMPLSWVIQQQIADETVLYRPRYGNRDQQFKLLSVNMRRPEVLALGSSRILQFRAGFFNRQPDSFYNAAAPAWRLPQVLELLENIAPEATPEVLILAIDLPWFNDSYTGDLFPDERSDFDHLFDSNSGLVKDVLMNVPLDRSGFSLGSYLDRREPGAGGLALGLRAIRDGHGFRGDGSEQYGDFLIAGWLYPPNTREAHLVWMREGREMYAYGDTVSASALAMMERLLSIAQARGVTVIGFLPSYMPSLWNEMNARGNHAYMEIAASELQSMFARYGYPFFDFSDGATINTTDDEFFDGWHASELSNLRLYMQMAEALPDILGAYSDVDALHEIAASASSTWSVFGMDSASD